MAEEVKQHMRSSNRQAGVRWPSDGQRSTVKKINPFYAYTAQETSFFILLFWLNWLGNVEVDTFRRLCHFSFDYHVRVSQEKVLIWSTRISVSLHWSLRPDSRCCRIEYHYQHYLDLAVHHNRRHASFFALFSHRISYFWGYWLKVNTCMQFFTFRPFSFIVNPDQRETMEKTLAPIVRCCYSHTQRLEQQQ